MRVTILSMACAACLASAAPADDVLSAETLNAIKRATVFIKIEANGLTGSASGFVMQVTGNSALIVTNLHVIEPKVEIEVQPRPNVGANPPGRPPISRPLPSPSTTPRTIIKTLKNVTVTIVFDSGTKKERSAKAEVVAVDPAWDLAVISVKNVDDLPVPIEVGNKVELVETMTVYSFGFPFGKALSTGKGSPAITVGKAAISSLRLSDDGELALVQIDGSLNPGNSGGPIVDARGQLVGIAVATIRNSSGIGLAIPGNQLKHMLDGRIGAAHLTSKTIEENLSIDVDVAVIDPLKKITSVELHYVGASQLKGNTKKEIESLEGLLGYAKAKLSLEKQLASANLVLNGAAKEKELLLQVVYTVDGKDKKTKVFRQSIQQAVVAKNTPESTPVSKDGETKILGGGSDKVFKDQAPDDGLLIGLEIGLDKWFNSDMPKALVPIYRTAKGEVKGKQYGTKIKNMVIVKAKEGYAVGAITAKAGLLVDGFSVTFMRVTAEGKLDPKDSYDSEWIGGKGGGRETKLGGDGTPVIGILGKAANNEDVTGLGLILKKG
jgi:S1-C subfamily serine protease